MKLRLVLGLMTAAAILGAGCGSAGGGDGSSERAELTAIDGIGDRTIQVTTTTNIVTDLIRELGGDRVEVTGLMGPGVDPHLYKASASDVDRLRDADVIFFIGRDLEGRMGDVLEEIGQRQPAVPIGEGIDERELLPAAKGQGNYEYDPHVWFDTDLWADAATEAARGL